MKKIKIITDSTSYIPKDYAIKNGIDVIPLKYIFKEKTYEEAYAGEFESYYNELINSEDFPKTSQPSTGEIYNAFEKALKNYDYIIAVFLSSKLSGVYNNAIIAKNMLNDVDGRIGIIDSKLTTAALRFLIEDAVELRDEGESFKDILNYLENKKKKISAHLTVETLQYLNRGGRISKLEYKAGDFLKIKPIIELNNGSLKLIDKVRGTKKSIKKIIEYMGDDVRKIRICHIMNYENAEKLKRKLESEIPGVEIKIEEIGPVIGSHLGPNAIGICYY